MRQIEQQLLKHLLAPLQVTAKECIPLFYGYRGSLAHGTYIEGLSSDIDLFVVLQYPKQYYYGLGNIGIQSSGNYTETFNDIVYDVEYFEITKFLTLLLNNSPNCINYLFINKDDRIIWAYERLWNYIKNNYTEFVSQKYVKALMYWCNNLLEDFNKNSNYKDLANAYQYIVMAQEYILSKQIKTNRTHIDANKIKQIKLGNVYLPTTKHNVDIGYDVLTDINWRINFVESNIENILPYNKVNRTEIENHLNIILWTLNHQDENCNE